MTGIVGTVQPQPLITINGPQLQAGAWIFFVSAVVSADDAPTLCRSTAAAYGGLHGDIAYVKSQADQNWLEKLLTWNNVYTT